MSRQRFEYFLVGLLASVICCAAAEPDWTDGWRMAGANPQRTSWTAEEVRGTLKPVWLKPFEPYISMKVHAVAADGMIFVATSAGLYAIDAETGEEKWVYPTELPLGHSPTVVGGAAYVGCFDKRIHAVDAKTGKAVWTSEPAGAGFQVNPLVVEGRVYAGNRDGVFYCFDAASGALVWKYETELRQPILFSAAYADGTVYFAANDMRAYALDAKTGTLKWRSEKLPGVGFHSWWPVVYGDLLVLPGSTAYRTQAHHGPGPLAPDGSADIQRLDGIDVYPEFWRADADKNPPYPYVGPVKDNFLDMTRVLEYHAAKPWRRTMLVLDRATGTEKTFECGEPGKQYYIPALWWGTHGGNRAPPVVAADGRLYYPQSFIGNKWIQAGLALGWQPDDRRLKIVSAMACACDEPVVCAGGGNLVYWILCATRRAGAMDVAMPCDRNWEEQTPDKPYHFSPHSQREWQYFSYNIGKTLKLPEPDGAPDGKITWFFKRANNRQSQVGMFGGNTGGGYGLYGDQCPPIPYKGKVYFIIGGNINALSAWAPDVKEDVRHLPVAELAEAPSAETPTPAAPQPDQDPLRRRLAAEIEKIIAAGTLRPGWFSSGIYDFMANWGFRTPYGDAYLVDYWHDPVDTICAIARALPLLPAETAERAKQYLQAFVEKFPPWQYSHVGWKDGAAREVYELPPDIESEFGAHDAEFYSKSRTSVRLFYGLWKYAEIFGNAAELFDTHKHRMDKPISFDILRSQAFLLNACIANRIGYLKLEEMAGSPESKTVREDLEKLIELRFETLTKEMVVFPGTGDHYERQINLFRNFLYMPKELAERIRTHTPPPLDEDELEDIALDFDLAITKAESEENEPEIERLKAEKAAVIERYRFSRVPALKKTQDIVATHTRLAPYWFVVKAEEGIQEGNHRPYQDRYGLFQAMAQILKTPRHALEKYIDVPACPVGDLYYIENLCAALEAAP